MIKQPIIHYFAALERLIKGCPKIVPKGTKISNDSVALEAGRGKGSIKKSRHCFEELILAIDEAAAEQTKPKNEHKNQLNKVKSTSEQFRRDWESALVREISLIIQVYEMKKVIAGLTGAKVLPIRSGK